MIASWGGQLVESISTGSLFSRFTPVGTLHTFNKTHHAEWRLCREWAVRRHAVLEHREGCGRASSTGAGCWWRGTRPTLQTCNGTVRLLTLACTRLCARCSPPQSHVKFTSTSRPVSGDTSQMSASFVKKLHKEIGMASASTTEVPCGVRADVGPLGGCQPHACRFFNLDVEAAELTVLETIDFNFRCGTYRCVYDRARRPA